MSGDGDEAPAIPLTPRVPMEVPNTPKVVPMEMLVLLTPDSNAMDMLLATVMEFKGHTVDIFTPNSTFAQVQGSMATAQHVAASRKRVYPQEWGVWFPPTPSDTGEIPPEWKADVDKYKKRVVKLEKRAKAHQAEVERLQQELTSAMARYSNLHLEFEQFQHDVQELQAQYVKVTDTNQRILWEYLPQHDSSLSLIPALAHDIIESVTIVGDYTIHGTLGEGQYASVYSCSRNPAASMTHHQGSTGGSATLLPSSPTVDNVCPSPPNLALKAINKSKLTDITGLVRVHSEIAALSDPALRHPSLLCVHEVIHTSKFIYLVTERGGKDLFDFFGPHDKGVSEATALRITFKIAEAVKHMHLHGYCHRDLKPENILFTHDNYMVKIVDFGLCAKVGTAPLYDFCGSPGFFAPEMLLHDQYDGQKADVWSIGCILLELVLGNTFFLKTWMTAYHLDVLSDRAHFQKLVQTNVTAMHTALASNESYSSEAKSLLKSMLCEDAATRPTIFDIAEHPWFDHHHRQPSAKHRERLHKAASKCEITSRSSAAHSPTRPTSAEHAPVTLPSIKVPEKPSSPQHHMQPR
ncbi:CAMK/CAMKL protein kinase [Aphanomyces invadans]|uniref:CAMK/CAMKL protein kinase n=1 Tax=Aphanomyces invadans TaxID=157072 RepID=A0A024TEC5_9STRA|nr:CAMK/CAMKL protein kinase [Aphanomyces invadans]ETV91712.1 CAMK/CAMKL protein kinase [Aphanomyces invadans]|eukprot:XP_008879638.1 CAMK/CAMKL protein kinase [Aphanomyces invadans]